MFYVGQKVVCINDHFSNRWDVVLNKPKKGSIYTIRSIELFRFLNGEVEAVLLSEIVNPIDNWYHPQIPHTMVCECPFPSKKFKPLEERKTDISIFQAMLKELENV